MVCLKRENEGLRFGGRGGPWVVFREPPRLLVLAPSNHAVDEIVRRLVRDTEIPGHYVSLGASISWCAKSRCWWVLKGSHTKKESIFWVPDFELTSCLVGWKGKQRLF